MLFVAPPEVAALSSLACLPSMPPVEKPTSGFFDVTPPVAAPIEKSPVSVCLDSLDVVVTVVLGFSRFTPSLRPSSLGLTSFAYTFTFACWLTVSAASCRPGTSSAPLSMPGRLGCNDSELNPDCRAFIDPVPLPVMPWLAPAAASAATAASCNACAPRRFSTDAVGGSTAGAAVGLAGLGLACQKFAAAGLPCVGRRGEAVGANAVVFAGVAPAIFWLSASTRTDMSCGGPLVARPTTWSPFSTTSSKVTGTLYFTAGPLPACRWPTCSVVESVVEFECAWPMFAATAAPAEPEMFGLPVAGRPVPGTLTPTPQAVPLPWPWEILAVPVVVCSMSTPSLTTPSNLGVPRVALRVTW